MLDSFPIGALAGLVFGFLSGIGIGGGSLLMIWSSFTAEGYCEAIARSESGTVAGPWKQEKLLYSKDGGHGMIFRRMGDNALNFVCHKPNKTPLERPVFTEICEENDTLRAK